MRITLNLATRPFADLGPAIKRLRIGMGVLAGVALLLAIGIHAIHRKAEAARQRDHSLDSQIARVNQESQGYKQLMSQPDNVDLLQQVALLNSLIDEKGFSWTLAMEDLETVLPGGVQVDSLEPARQKDGRIVLHLRVVGPRDRAIDLVRNLEHSKRFLLPRIVGENAETSEKPGMRLEPVTAADRVDFDLLADYNPATEAERKEANEKAKKNTQDDCPAKPARALGHPIPLPEPGMGRPPYKGPAPRGLQGPSARSMLRPGGNQAVPVPRNMPGGPQ